MANNISEYGNIARVPGAEPAGSTFSYPTFTALRQANQTLAGLAAGAPMGSVNVVVDGNAEIATAYLATGNFHQLLGVRAIRGRTLLRTTTRRTRRRWRRSARSSGAGALAATRRSSAR